MLALHWQANRQQQKTSMIGNIAPGCGVEVVRRLQTVPSESDLTASTLAFFRMKRGGGCRTTIDLV